MAEQETAKQHLIRVNGREILFPPLDLNTGELCDAENFFGADFAQPDRSGMRLTAAFLYIAIKRVDPSVTVDDVRALDPAILNQLSGDASPPAGTAAQNGSSEPSAPSSTPSSAASG